VLGLRLAIPVFAITTLLVVPLQATTSYYTGGVSAETNFTGALGSLTLLNPTLLFSGGDLGSGGLYNASGTGIDFLGFDDFFFNNPSDFTVASGKLTAEPATGVVKIVFPVTGIYAFGIHITEKTGSGNWCIELTPTGTCNNNVFSSSSSNVQFFGFVSTTPITAPLYIHPATGNPSIVLTDFEAYSVPQVPEPHTMLLVGMGLVILSMARRKLQIAPQKR
jgi:hypothetical protein